MSAAARLGAFLSAWPGVALVEVRYLYAYEGGSLFQPTLKGPRADLTEEAAQLVQLKYKAAAPDDAPGMEL